MNRLQKVLRRGDCIFAKMRKQMRDNGTEIPNQRLHPRTQRLPPTVLVPSAMLTPCLTQTPSPFLSPFGSVTPTTKRRCTQAERSSCEQVLHWSRVVTPSLVTSFSPACPIQDSSSAELGVASVGRKHCCQTVGTLS
jgi:hypothetical protein